MGNVTTDPGRLGCESIIWTLKVQDNVLRVDTGNSHGLSLTVLSGVTSGCRINTHFVIDLYSEPEAITLELVFIIQRLYNLQRACPITISYHGEFVSTISTVLYHLTENTVSVISDITYCNVQAKIPAANGTTEEVF
jgi:hypothetical protein